MLAGYLRSSESVSVQDLINTIELMDALQRLADGDLVVAGAIESRVGVSVQLNGRIIGHMHPNVNMRSPTEVPHECRAF